jgi:hypothetical protein
MVEATSRMKQADKAAHSSPRNGGESRVLDCPAIGVLQKIAAATVRTLPSLLPPTNQKEPISFPKCCGGEKHFAISPLELRIPPSMDHACGRGSRHIRSPADHVSDTISWRKGPMPIRRLSGPAIALKPLGCKACRGDQFVFATILRPPTS